MALAADVLVADRLSDSVYRYSADGTFLNVVLREVAAAPGDSDFINQPTGLALSPDATRLYVSSSQTNTVVRYDYDAVAGAATNPSVFAAEANGIQFPNAIVFSPEGETIYVSNLGGSGVAKFNLNGSSAGPPIPPFGENGEFFQFSGLAWTPDDELLVGGFVDFPAGSNGAVGKSNAAVTALDAFIGPSSSLMGASGLLVHDDYVYVTGMFASNMQRFRLDDGSLDPNFGVAGLAFPQGLMVSPDGNGMLAGILGYANGAGYIAHYDFDGNLIGDGIFAAPGGGGFVEATAFITVPDVPGDFNGDRIVDATDLATLTANFGDNSGQATLAMGDADRNRDVDGNDVLIWQQNVSAASGPGVRPVPEPSFAALAIVVLQGATLRRSHRPRVRPPRSAKSPPLRREEQVVADGTTRQAMGRASQQAARRRFASDIVVPQYEAVYGRVISQG